MEGIPRVPRLGSRYPIALDHSNRDSVIGYATLFFIKSCGLRYLGPSSDPIFPADVEDPSDFWTDSSPYVHVIGCRETDELCNSAGVCYVLARNETTESFNISSAASASEAAVLKSPQSAMVLSTFASYLYNVPKLFAERLHFNGLSFALDDEHWHVEVRRQFDILLAHLQGAVVDMVRGKDSYKANHYELYPNPDAMKEACSRVKFQTVGWRNINVVELALFSTALFFLWISTIKYGERILLIWMYRLLTRSSTKRAYEALKERTRNGVAALVQSLMKLLKSVWRFHRHDAR